MKGYVYVQQILPASSPPNSTGPLSPGDSTGGNSTNWALVQSAIASQPLWVSRYLISFPYCGLKWFREEPVSDSFNRLLTDNSAGGWVFGGSVQLTGYVVEEPVMHGDIFIYPFVVELAKGNSVTRIRMAAEDDPTRLLWVDELQHSVHYQNYLYCCKECNAMPRHAIAAALEDGTRELSIRNIKLNSSALGSIVMYSRIVGVDGCVLQKLHLENAQIADRHVPLICAFMTFTHFLESLSLHGNYLTCTGVVELADTVPSTKSLKELNLSNNFISDKGACAIAEACRALKRLKSFDISRNRLTSQSAKALALYLARYDSEVTHLNFSFNKLGDSVASLVCLLLTNPTAKLQVADLSYCGLTDVGVAELAAAVPQSRSLNVLRLVGNNFQNGKSVGKLVEAVHDHYIKFRRLIHLMKDVRLHPSNVPQISEMGQDDPLCVEIGGVSLDPQLGSMSVKTLRSAISYMTDNTVVDELVLRRRIVLGGVSSQAVAAFDKGVAAKMNLKDRHLMLQEESAKNEALRCSDGICCVRVQYSRTITDAYEVLDALSRCLRIDRRQFVLVSTTMTDSWNSCFVTFSIVEPVSSDEKPMPTAKNLSILANGQGNTSEQMRLEGGESISLQFSSPRVVFDRLGSLCKLSDPKIRRIGITTALIYIPPSNPNDKSPGNTHQYQIEPLIKASAKLEASSSVAAQEIVDFLPPFFPVAANDSAIMNNDDADDDSDEEDDVAGEEGGQGKKIGKHRLMSVDAMLEDADDGDSASVMTAERVMMEELNHRMAAAITKGYEEAATLDNDSCHFWEGVFGVEKWKKTVNLVIKAPLTNNGSFISVEFRKRLCDAMYKRDWGALASLIELSKRDGIPGGMAILLGDKLYSEIASLRHESEALKSIARTSADIGEVETFLLHCANLGYMGPETFAAIERREQLVRLLVSEKKENHEKLLHQIKMRALITNAMISRDLDEVTRIVDTYSTLTKIEPDGVLDEVKAAKKLLDYDRECAKNLRFAMDIGTLETIENAISSAAYHNIYIQPYVDEAANRLNEISGNYSSILDDLTVAIRFGDQEALDRSVFEIRRIGYSHSSLSSMTISKIFALRNRLFQEEVLRARIIEIANSISVGTEFFDENVVRKLLRKVRLMQLENDPPLVEPLSLLNARMRLLSGMQFQEDIIIRLLEERNVTRLAEILAGRGDEKYYLAASSAEAMHDWVEALRSICVSFSSTSSKYGSNKAAAPKTDKIIKSGPLELASKDANGVLKNWRVRYFILQGNDLSFYAKLGGERKGSVRVVGGSVRSLTTEESWGHSNVFELQEGRDLALVDPDLLEEVRKQVNIFRKDQLEDDIVKGISENDDDKLSKALESAETYGISLDAELVGQARALLLRQQHKKLKADLREALVSLSRRKLVDILRLAKRLKLDSSHYLFRRAMLHVDRSEIELALLRTRAMFQLGDDAVFKKSLGLLQQLDAKRMSLREKFILMAIWLQYSARKLLNNVLDAFPSVAEYIQPFQDAMTGAASYYVENEPMQLARIVAEGIDPKDNGKLTGADAAIRTLTGGSDAGIITQSSSGANAFALERYPNLARVAITTSVDGDKASQSGLMSSILGGRKSTNTSQRTINTTISIKFSTDAIHSSLSKLAPGWEQNARDAFVALQVVMGDRSIGTYKELVTSDASMFSGQDVVSLSNDLVYVGFHQDELRDELYLHLCKQLNSNPSVHSRWAGWSLFGVYMNCFHPSAELFPYIKDFVTSSLSNELRRVRSDPELSVAAAQNGLRASSGSRPTSAVGESFLDDLEVSAKLPRLVRYALKKLHVLETVYKNNLTPHLFSTNERLLSDVLSRSIFEIEVVLPTGALHRLKLGMWEIDSPLSIVAALLQQIVSVKDANALETRMELYNSEGQVNTAVLEKYFGLFRGFFLYRSADSSAEASQGPHVIDSSKWCHDHKTLPAIASESDLIQWADDIKWELLCSQYADNNTVGRELDENGDVIQSFRPRARYYLRRRIASSGERFISQYELFGDDVSDGEIMASKRMWTSWLKNAEKITSMRDALPSDMVRIDMLFAEESKLFNAMRDLYSPECVLYLTALQLSLLMYADSLEDYDNILKSWGSGSAPSSIDHSDLSLRTCKRKASSRRYSTRDPAMAEDAMPSRPRSVMRRNSVSARRSSVAGSERRKSVRRNSLLLTSAHTGKVAEVSADPDSPLLRKLAPATISEEAIQFLKARCEDLNIPISSDEEFNAIVSWIGEFQSIAISLGISILSPRFRYMMKRAYVHYVMALPYYASHTFEGYLLNNYALYIDKDNKTGKSSLSDLERFRKIKIIINGNGVHLVNPASGELLFTSVLYDLSTITSLPAVVPNPAEDSDDINNVQLVYPLLTLNVNGLILQILTKSADSIKNLVEAFCLESLAWGSFPHGTEGGNDVYALGETFIASSDSKEIMKNFIRDFPLLPKPPAPAPWTRSPDYFEAPQSQKAMIAEMRAEQERRELEMSRRAVESHNEKYSSQLESGRMALNRLLQDDEEEDDDDDGIKAQRDKFGRGLREESEKTRQMRVLSALSGNSMRPTNITVDVMEPVKTSGNSFNSLQFNRDLKAKSQAPPFLASHIVASTEQEQDTSAPIASEIAHISRAWPSDLRILPLPKAYHKIDFRFDPDWSSSAFRFVEDQRELLYEDAEREEEIRSVKSDEYLPMSMQNNDSFINDATYQQSDYGEVTRAGSSTVIRMTSAVGRSVSAEEGDDSSVDENEDDGEGYVDNDDGDYDDVDNSYGDDAGPEGATNHADQLPPYELPGEPQDDLLPPPPPFDDEDDEDDDGDDVPPPPDTFDALMPPPPFRLHDGRDSAVSVNSEVTTSDFGDAMGPMY